MVSYYKLHIPIQIAALTVLTNLVLLQDLECPIKLLLENFKKKIKMKWSGTKESSYSCTKEHSDKTKNVYVINIF